MTKIERRGFLGACLAALGLTGLPAKARGWTKTETQRSPSDPRIFFATKAVEPYTDFLWGDTSNSQWMEFGANNDVLVLLNGKQVEHAKAANVQEGWVDIFDDKAGKCGYLSNGTRREYGRVQILFKNRECRERYILTRETRFVIWGDRQRLLCTRNRPPRNLSVSSEATEEIRSWTVDSLNDTVGKATYGAS